MDKNFNEEELSEIMKEIEALEGNLDVEEVRPAATPIMEQFVKMDESQAVPKPEPVFKAAEVYAMPSQPKPRPSAPHHSHAPSSMTFKVSGDLHLELNFDIGGKVVCLEVTENCFNIQMEGGMTFSLPIKKSA
jgi:hypothetical protein